MKIVLRVTYHVVLPPTTHCETCTCKEKFIRSFARLIVLSALFHKTNKEIAEMSIPFVRREENIPPGHTVVVEDVIQTIPAFIFDGDIH